MMTEEEILKLMKSDAYTNKFNPDYEKTQNLVRQGFENLYPEDDRNIHPEKYYVWYTRGDEKVRDTHAERQGMVFSWDNPPEGGHPGEDYGCRCLALEYKPPYDKARLKAELEEKIEEIQSQIDWKNGLITNLNENIDQLKERALEIKNIISNVTRQGFEDGYEGAQENLDNLDVIVGKITKSPLPELAPWLGGIIGAASTRFAKFREFCEELSFIEDKINESENEILRLQNEANKLMIELERLERELEKLN